MEYAYDEVDEITPEMYELVLPKLKERDSRINIISTPRGKNWLYEMWKKSNDGD